MPLQVNDLVVVAETLAGVGGEPHDRSSISRAYYAVFHHARQWHANLLIPGHNNGPAGGEHQQLINQLKSPDSMLGPSQAKESRMFGAKLQAMRDRRVKSDYTLSASVPRSECDAQLSQAKDAIQKY